MFSIDQIDEAQSNVKSGADFPEFIRNIKKIGVLYYETFVTDGHSNYFGVDDLKISSNKSYEPITISTKVNKKQFQTDLKLHQHGKTNYPTFCNDCAKSGIKKWRVSVEKMDCTYFDKLENVVLVESIPV